LSGLWIATTFKVPGPFPPGIGFIAGHFLDEINTDETSTFLNPLLQAFAVKIDGRNDSLLGTDVADMSSETPSIDLAESHHLVSAQVFFERESSPPVGINAARFLDDEAFDKGPATLDILLRNAVIADHRISHGDDLTVIGRIGQNFLITHHRGVKHHFAD